MSSIKTHAGSNTDWSALNGAAHRDGAQRKAQQRIDANGDQGLGIGELKAARAQVRAETGLDTHGSAALRKRIDDDADGVLSGQELEQAKNLVPPPKDTLEFVQRRLASESESPAEGTVFGRIDADGDGGLRKSEFMATGPARRPGADDATPDSVQTTGGSAEAAYGQLGRAFDAADRDGDGSLSKTEFTALKREVRGAVADALGISADAESLTASAGVEAYRKDRFDLVQVAQTLSPD